MLKILWFILGAIFLLPLLNLLLAVRPFTFKTNDDPARYGLAYENVSFSTDDGLTLRGWFIPAQPAIVHDRQPGDQPQPGRRHATILVGHGYPFDKANILGHVLFLHRQFNLFLIDFRYFGESEGAYTTVGLREVKDVHAAIEYLKQRPDVDPHRIGAMGFSMSASIFILARHPAIKAIVAESPYASLRQILKRQFFFLPGPLSWPILTLTRQYALLLFGVDIGQASPVNAASNLNTPLLLIHGESDSQIPIEHSRQIAAQADPAITELWAIPHADHGQAHAREGSRYETKVLTFLQSHLPKPK